MQLPLLELETSSQEAATMWISIAAPPRLPRLSGFKYEQNRFSKGIMQNNITAYIYIFLRHSF